MAATLGFLSVRRHEEHGYFGGMLVVNTLARPLEFHCTMPVKPTRAQQLLYGNTLDDFVSGEQIAKALLLKAKLKPELVFTDCPAALAVSLVSQHSVAYLRTIEGSTHSTLQVPRTSLPTARIEVGEFGFEVTQDANVTAESLSDILEQLAPSFELQEPFERVVEALCEAHPIAKAA